MTIKGIVEMGLIKDRTEVYIRDEDFRLIASGNWYQDNIIAHMDDEVECFTWQDDDKFYIDIKAKAE